MARSGPRLSIPNQRAITNHGPVVVHKDRFGFEAVCERTEHVGDRGPQPPLRRALGGVLTDTTRQQLTFPRIDEQGRAVSVGDGDELRQEQLASCASRFRTEGCRIERSGELGDPLALIGADIEPQRLYLIA